MAVPPLAVMPISVRFADGAAIDGDRAAPGVADADGVAGVAAAVDVADGDRAAVGRGRCDATVAGGGDVAGAVIPATKEFVLEPRWAAASAAARTPAAAPIAAAFTRRVIVLPLFRPCWTYIVRHPSLPCWLPN